MNRGEELLRRQFEEGPLERDEDAELEALLDGSKALRERYARYVELERALEGTDVPSAQVERMLARGAPAPARDHDAPEAETRPRASILGPIPAAAGDAAFPSSSSSAQVGPPARAKAWWTSGAAALLAAAAFLLVLRPSSDPDIGVRSGGSDGRPAWIAIYQVGEDERTLVPVEDEARADRPFAFAYSSLADSPYPYLAIVGRDAEGRLHWFHPAYTDPEDAPLSVSIEVGQADVELGELVRVDAAPGPMEICGLFTKEPLDVQAQDVRLEAGGPWPSQGARDCRVLAISAS